MDKALVEKLGNLLFSPDVKAQWENLNYKNPETEEEKVWAGVLLEYHKYASPVGFLRMTPDEREVAMEENPPVVTSAWQANGNFSWEWTGCGFGGLSFGYDSEKKEWFCDTECMGPESTRMLLHAFADYVADQLKPVIEAEREELEKRRNKDD